MTPRESAAWRARVAKSGTGAAVSTISVGGGRMPEMPESCGEEPEVEQFAWDIFADYMSFEFSMETLPRQEINGRRSYEPVTCDIRSDFYWLSMDDCSGASAKRELDGAPGVGPATASAVADIVGTIIEKIKIPKLPRCARVINGTTTPDTDKALGHIYTTDAVQATYAGEISTLPIVSSVDVRYSSTGAVINYYVYGNGSGGVTLTVPTTASAGNSCS